MRTRRLITILCGAAATLLLSASLGNAQTTGHDHAAAAADNHAMMADMQAAQKKLDDLVAQMNAATGPEKVDRMATVITEMATMHKTMCTQMMNGEMMSMMMRMQRGAGQPAPAPKSSDADQAEHHQP
jgi:hypothetical protein